MSRTPLLLALGGLLLLYPFVAPHRYETSKPYDVDEAYEVYSAILPTIGESPLVIRTETRTPEICLQPLDAQAERTLRPVINNYLELNALPWQLQKHFDIKRHYELLAEEELSATFPSGMNGSPSMEGWGTFYERHPDSKGWIELSAVGFNADKTIAVVYMGYYCGDGCRGGEFRALQKDAGKVATTNRKGTVEPLPSVYSRPPCLRIRLARCPAFRAFRNLGFHGPIPLDAFVRLSARCRRGFHFVTQSERL